MYRKAFATVGVWVAASIICITVQDSIELVMMGVVSCTFMIWLLDLDWD